jgi:hypothetical protein
MGNGIWRIKDGKSTMVLDAMTLGGHPERHRAVARREVSLRQRGQRCSATK